MDMGLIRCQICSKYTSSTKEGRSLHMKQQHGLRIRVDMPKYSPEEKARIVERGERKLGLQHFITPSPLPIPSVVHESTAILSPLIPAQYCGPEGKVCVWESNGWEICGPCGVRREWELQQRPIEDIKYQD